MDTSEVYVKMCNCEEVREIWAKDDYAFDEDYGIFVDREYGQRWVSCHVADKDYYIFLPNQDRIQEMLHTDEQWLEKDNSPFKFPIRVGDSKWNYILQQFIRYNDMASIEMPDKLGDTVFSFEQLWLAFYMKEKYGKGWDGEKWA